VACRGRVVCSAMPQLIQRTWSGMLTNVPTMHAHTMTMEPLWDNSEER
jgi:hypothetical protein